MIKNAMTNFRSWLMFMAMIIASSTMALAAVPSAPENLAVPAQGNNIPNGIVLEWQMQGSNTIHDGFKIYLAEGHTSQMSDFSLRDTMPTPFDSLAPGQTRDYYHYLRDLAKGDYTVYVTAYNSDGESVASNLLEVKVKGSKWEDRIYFTTEIPDIINITKNNIWNFNIDAEAETDITIKYDLENAPNGMIINEDTGVITWTPANSGNFEVYVVAYEENDENNRADLWFPIHVFECDTPATIKGTVRNEDGDLIQYGTAGVGTVYNGTTILLYPEYDTEIVNGEFTINADEGDYIVIIHSPGYDRYPSNNLSDVEHVHYACGSYTEIDYTLTRKTGPYSKIKFTSFPTENIIKTFLNQEWTFDFDAEVKDSVEILYKLMYAPEGMTIDSLTGEVAWTPTNIGHYIFDVVAFDPSGNAIEAIETFTTYVYSCTEPITVSGTVNYEPENPGDPLEPITYGFVFMKRVDGLDSAAQFPNQEYYAEIKNGTYSIQADAGTYILFFTGRGEFNSEYWEDAATIDEATEVVLECGNTYTFNALVEEYVEPEVYTVSGTVTDEDTGEGIPYAYIEIIGTSNNNFHLLNVVIADADGEYEVQLYENIDYVFRASTQTLQPSPNDSLVIGGRYIPEYYDNVTDITEATVITLTSDLDNIDFELTKLDDYDNDLYGAVLNNDSTGYLSSWVVAFLVQNNGNNQEYINWGITTTTGDNSGAFHFEGLIPGEYIILAFPEDMEYAPGYYVAGELATLNWKEATRINVSATGSYYGNNIRLNKMKDVVGGGIISGRIGKKGKDGGIVKGEGEPIKGALVYTIAEDGTIVKFERTNELGAFEVDKLANGKYNVIIDKVGFNHLSMWAEITDEQKEVDIEDITLNEMPTSVEERNSAEVNLYPNPVVSQLTVNLGTLENNATISLIDLSGVTLYESTVMSNESHQIDVENLASGMYYLKVKNGEEVTVLPVSISK